jgi:hypothetical protein
MFPKQKMARMTVHRRLLSTNCRAIVCDDFGGPEVMQVKETVLPALQPGQVGTRSACPLLSITTRTSTRFTNHATTLFSQLFAPPGPRQDARCWRQPFGHLHAAWSAWSLGCNTPPPPALSIHSGQGRRRCGGGGGGSLGHATRNTSLHDGERDRHIRIVRNLRESARSSAAR